MASLSASSLALGMTTAIIFSISILGSVFGKKLVRYKRPVGIYFIS
ncbi:MAG: hypothetical protein AB7S66_02160 [Sphaerochaeta sp.]